MFTISTHTRSDARCAAVHSVFNVDSLVNSFWVLYVNNKSNNKKYPLSEYFANGLDKESAMEIDCFKIQSLNWQTLSCLQNAYAKFRSNSMDRFLSQHILVQEFPHKQSFEEKKKGFQKAII